MLTDLVSLDKAQVWLRGWRAILGQARVLRWFDPLHVPGLFQTEAYARAVFESDETLTDASELAFLGGQIGGQELMGPSDLLRLQRTWEATPQGGVAGTGVDRADEGSGGVMELTSAVWRKSSRSGSNDQCVEVATNLPDVVGVRDSKDPSGPVLTFDPYTWRIFMAALPR
jgi:hypothetical protein